LNLRESYLELTQAAFLLLEEEPLVLASPEDAAFFRRSFQKKKENPEEPPPLFCPLPSKPKPKKQIAEPTPLSCEPPPPAPIQKHSPISPSFSFSAFSSLFAKIAPDLPLLKDIPDDTLAKNIAHRWKTKNKSAPVTLLTYSESATHQKLLQEIIKAIDVYFGPAKMVEAEEIEKEKQWEAFLSSDGLKLIIVCDYTLWQLNELMKFYKEIPSQSTRTLGKIPLFLLPDLSLYLKDPLLKRSLWKALCQKIS
jgi:hypothetical protein